MFLLLAKTLLKGLSEEFICFCWSAGFAAVTLTWTVTFCGHKYTYSKESCCNVGL